MLYEKDGSVQLYADEMLPSGIGALYLAFEQLKNRLAEEGLFAADKKKPLPKYPQRIAVVTSPTGAALKDILNIAGRRNPLVKLIVIPSAVQGEAAPREIAEAIARATAYEDIDVLIGGRGGGSLDELWAFNTEEVARAIAASRIPVISAVGHEIDFTIADFAADLRAPTPSAAAEIAIPMLSDLQACLCSYQEKLRQKMAAILERQRTKVREIASHRSLALQSWKLEQSRQDTDLLAERLYAGMTGFLAKRDGILKLLSTKLDALSPLTTLGRGYILAYNAEGKTINSAGQIAEGDELRLQLCDGCADCQVRKVNKS
jgi:exodeoxyribonuclease VII large subunit